MADTELELRVQALEKRLEALDTRDDSDEGGGYWGDEDSRVRSAVSFASNVFRSHANTPHKWDGTWGSDSLPQDWDGEAWFRFEKMLTYLVRREITPRMCLHDINV